MFGFFKKQSKQEVATASQKESSSYTAPGTEIHYSPELIDTLQQDHKELLALYGDIANAFKEKRWEC